MIDCSNGLNGLLSGWKLFDYSGQEFFSKIFNQTPRLVGFLGAIGSGKTSIQSQMYNVNLPCKITDHTKGISIKSIQDQTILLDTKELDSPKSLDFNNKSIDDDEFLIRLILHITNIFILVVQNSTKIEIEKIIKIKEYIISKQNEFQNHRFIVIHNFSNVSSISDEEIMWKENIFDHFKGEFKKSNNIIPDFYIESGILPIHHFCIWDNYSELGRKNRLVFDHIKSSIKTHNYQNNTNPILKRFINSLNTSISSFLQLKISNEDQMNFIKFEKADTKDVKDEYIGMLVPNNNKLKEMIYTYETLNNQNKSNSELNYSLKESKDEIKIIIDIPGLFYDESKIIEQSYDPMNVKFTEFITKENDIIKIGIIYFTEGSLELIYERILNNDNVIESKKPNGIFKKKIEFLKNYKFDEIDLTNSGNGELIIKIKKKEIKINYE